MMMITVRQVPISSVTFLYELLYGGHIILVNDFYTVVNSILDETLTRLYSCILSFTIKRSSIADKTRFSFVFISLQLLFKHFIIEHLNRCVPLSLRFVSKLFSAHGM